MISVLFAARDSVYKTIDGLDVWDEDRNALKWPGGNPGIFHPPCRLWSKWMRHFSKAPESEKELAIWAVEKVRKYGGVLEHPACSRLWKQEALPKPGSRDQWGLSIALYQQWFGHSAQKATWLYICGTSQLPEIPLILGQPACHYSAVRKLRHPDMQRLSHRQRQGTPLEFAKWLVETAKAVK
jgi:hypothetical protein